MSMLALLTCQADNPTEVEIAEGGSHKGNLFVTTATTINARKNSRRAALYGIDAEAGANVMRELSQIDDVRKSTLPGIFRDELTAMMVSLVWRASAQSLAEQIAI